MPDEMWIGTPQGTSLSVNVENLPEQTTPIPVIDNLPLDDYLATKEEIKTLKSQSKVDHDRIRTLKNMISGIFGKTEGITKAIMNGALTSKHLDIVTTEDLSKDEFVITIRIDRRKFYEYVN